MDRNIDLSWRPAFITMLRTCAERSVKASVELDLAADGAHARAFRQTHQVAALALGAAAWLLEMEEAEAAIPRKPAVSAGLAQ